MKGENRLSIVVITGKLNCYYLALAISEKRDGEKEEKLGQALKENCTK